MIERGKPAQGEKRDVRRESEPSRKGPSEKTVTRPPNKMVGEGGYRTK